MVCREPNDARRRNGLVARTRIPRRKICLLAGSAFFPTDVDGRQPETLGVLVRIESQTAILFLRRYRIFHVFQGIGQRLGPFDVAALAIGAYEPPEIMEFVHLTPEQAVQAFVDLNARALLGIHWGTFDLAEEPLDEPPQRMLAEIGRRKIDSSRAWIFK